MSNYEVNYEEYQKEFDNLPPDLQLISLNPKFCREFQTYNKNLQIIYWIFKENKKVFMNCFFLGKINNSNHFDIQSPYPYGGPICSTNDKLFLKSANQQFENWALNKNVLVEFYKFNPILDQKKWYDGKVINNRETVIIDLKKDLMENYEKRRFYDLKNIEKKNVLKIAKNPFGKKNFINTYKNNMKKIDADNFYFFSDEYLENIINFDFVDTWFVYINDKVVSAAIILNSEKSKVVEYFLGARDFNYDKYKSTVYLLHKISEHYKNKNYNKFYLGGGRSASDDDTLLFFKKGFSDLRSDFNIAHKIYDNKTYYDLKKKTKSLDETKILFYR